MTLSIVEFIYCWFFQSLCSQMLSWGMTIILSSRFLEFCVEWSDVAFCAVPFQTIEGKKREYESLDLCDNLLGEVVHYLAFFFFKDVYCLIIQSRKMIKRRHCKMEGFITLSCALFTSTGRTSWLKSTQKKIKVTTVLFLSVLDGLRPNLPTRTEMRII